MIEFIYRGKAKHLWKELALMLSLEQKTGLTLQQYTVELEPDSQN